MKNIFVLLIALLLMQTTFSQLNEGQIIYDRRINVHKRLSTEDQSMKNMLPEFNTTKIQLSFKGSETISTELSSPEEDGSMDEDGGERVVIRMGAGNEF